METSTIAYKKDPFEQENLLKLWNGNKPISKKEKRGLAVIFNHPGKRKVFESLLANDYNMALKYLVFIAHNPHVHYIRWDMVKDKFVTAS